MRLLKAFSLCLMLVCWTLPLYAGGFKIEGDRMENFKVTFDSSGVDQSSAEAVAKSLLDVKYSMYNSVQVRMTVEKVGVAGTMNLFSSLFTEEGMDRYFGKRLKKIEEMEKKKNSFQSSYSIDLGKGETGPEGTVVFHFTVKSSSKSPCSCENGKCSFCAKMREGSKEKCYRCQGTKVCLYCKGTKIASQERNEKGELITFQKDGVWLVKGIFNACSTCSEKGLCPRCKRPGVKCATCLGSGKCPSCKGAGKKMDSFLKGPNHFDIPQVSASGSETTTPEGFLKALEKSFQEHRILELKMGNAIYGEYKKFATLFMGEIKEAPASSQSLGFPTYKILKSAIHGDKAWLIYETIPAPKKENKNMGSHPVEYTPPAYMRKHALELIQKDGKWRVNQFYSYCYNCKAEGIIKGYSCPQCKKNSQYPSYCYQCKKSMEPSKEGSPCSSCKGTGFIPSDYVPFN